MELNNKNHLRKTLQDKRAHYSTTYQESVSKQCCHTLTTLPLWQKSQHVAFYRAHKGEVDPEIALLTAHEQGKSCYLPILNPYQPNKLLFLRYQPGDPLVPNRYDILEPTFASNKVFLSWKLDLVCTPLVAFDSMGNRLGMGQGFYDRTFAYLNQSSIPQPRLVGLAYNEQQQAYLNPESWDIPLHTIITEQHVYQPGIPSCNIGS